MKKAVLASVALVSVVVGLTATLTAVPLLARPAPAADAAGQSNALGIPTRVLAAYQAVDGWCPGLRWQLLAGIGNIESGHGTSGHAHADPVTGEVTPAIFGPPLDGANHTQQLPIGKWLGWFGLQGPWQQAAGPMQFLPGTFTEWAVDEDGDGTADPNDIDDAVATAANYLCQGRTGKIADERAAALRYNHDDRYASTVLTYANGLTRSAPTTPTDR